MNDNSQIGHPNQSQVGGVHYKSQYQHWDYVYHCLDGRYLEGNFTKYVSRFRLKNGLQDLLKAEHYLAKLMVNHAHGHVLPLVAGTWLHQWDSPAAFCDENGFTGLQRELLVGMTCWKGMSDLTSMAQKLQELILEQQKEEQRIQAIKAGVDVGVAPRVEAVLPTIGKATFILASGVEDFLKDQGERRYFVLPEDNLRTAKFEVGSKRFQMRGEISEVEDVEDPGHEARTVSRTPLTGIPDTGEEPGASYVAVDKEDEDEGRFGRGCAEGE